MIDPEQLASDRLSIFMAHGRPDAAAGPIALQAAALGTPGEWAWSAVSYLKCELSGTQGGSMGGAVEVSASAIGVLLAYVEMLAGELGIIPASAADEGDIDA